jgi:hypothetical protein
VIDHAQTDFYRGVAYLGQGTLRAVAELFDLPVE